MNGCTYLLIRIAKSVCAGLGRLLFAEIEHPASSQVRVLSKALKYPSSVYTATALRLLCKMFLLGGHYSKLQGPSSSEVLRTSD